MERRPKGHIVVRKKVILCCFWPLAATVWSSGRPLFNTFSCVITSLFLIIIKLIQSRLLPLLLSVGAKGAAWPLQVTLPDWTREPPPLQTRVTSSWECSVPSCCSGLSHCSGGSAAVVLQLQVPHPASNQSVKRRGWTRGGENLFLFTSFVCVFVCVRDFNTKLMQTCLAWKSSSYAFDSVEEPEVEAHYTKLLRLFYFSTLLNRNEKRQWILK